MSVGLQPCLIGEEATDVVLRRVLACCHGPQVIHLTGRFEIVSLVGTLSPDAHLHICLSDAEGKTVGGHALGDLEVFTTAEVVVGEGLHLHFSRVMDDRTGFPELLVRPRSQVKDDGQMRPQRVLPLWLD